MKSGASAITDRLQRYVRSLVKDDELANFISSINAVGEAYVFGGAARDVAYVGKRFVNDLDIFVSGRLDDAQVTSYSSYSKRTNFGGLRLLVGKYEVDIWELEKSHAFRYDSTSYITALNLLKTVCFSTDAIAVSLKTGRVLKTSAFDDTYASKRLDFVVPPPTLQPVVATRIARLAIKLNMELTPAVASYFIGALEEFGVSSLLDAESRWGRRRMLNEISIEEVKAGIRHSIDKAYSALGSPVSGRGEKVIL